MRPVVWAVPAPTCDPRYSGGTSSAVQRSIVKRSSGSLVSEGQTRCTRSSTPASMRAPPDEHDSISTAGNAARSVSSTS